MSLLQPQERLDVEVVIMVVCDQDQVDGRQILERQARGAYALGAQAAKGTDTLRIDRVSQHISSTASGGSDSGKGGENACLPVGIFR